VKGLFGFSMCDGAGNLRLQHTHPADVTRLILVKLPVACSIDEF
jgi:hypothetical protein